jgi:hypothetical protein
VGARQNADFDPDVTNLIKGAAVGTAALIDHLLATETQHMLGMSNGLNRLGEMLQTEVDENGHKLRALLLAGSTIAAVLLAVVLQFCGEGKAVGLGERSGEYEVKAAFLFHFAQFVDWPEESFHGPNSPFVYCTIGFDPFQGTLDSTLNGKTVGGRGFEVRHFKQAQEARGCHLLFIGEEQKRQIPGVLAQFRGAPVLIVGESEGFVEEGGMIGFSVEDSKVRFEVSLEAAQKSALKINARLLALAKTVIGGKRG